MSVLRHIPTTEESRKYGVLVLLTALTAGQFKRHEREFPGSSQRYDENPESDSQ
ncbi:hypothetical protein ACTXM3_06755 [Glutamicibacter arilaitensis]|uniref:Uncharacterized protein n=1 Tax=Glutamicibacter arilaitensis (strain DSM 16368 / CIP 108037 / IAM 15318 / JCM 13566 / NCIMB 14258 / Re117) TaxID=861360 RepID=A0ABM9PZ22_GLUAR|nr:MULTISPECIES: hypothetical protein [Glutamicibacter]CBT76558.1 hypothetical protein AARI_23380 [Glutamicibacter arilaitensis Re117]